MDIIECEGVVKDLKEMLKHVSSALETDEVCEVKVAVKVSRRDFLRLARTKQLEHAVILKIGLPQEILQFPDEQPVDVTVVTSDRTELVPMGQVVGI